MKQLLFITAMLFTITTFAQQTNFSGNWKINTQKTDFASLHAPSYILPLKLNMVQENSKIIIIRLVDDPKMQEHIDSAVLSFDSKVYQSRSYSDKKQSYSLNWDDNQKGFTVILHSVTDDNKLFQDATEKWSLSEDGKTLIINRSVEQASGLKYSIVAYYDKL
jgi:hypothetical protein